MATMKLTDAVVLVIGGNGQWAQGADLPQALKAAYRPKAYLAYVAHPDTRVDGLGGLVYPSGHEPKLIVRKTARK